MNLKPFFPNGLFVLLAIEKFLQHLITGLLFAIDIEGMRKPYIGPNLQVSDTNMVLFNFAYTLLFAAGIFLFMRNNPWGKRLVFWLALADIVLEFVFHGIGYITFSVLFSSAIVVLTLIWPRTAPDRRRSALS